MESETAVEEATMKHDENRARVAKATGLINQRETEARKTALTLSELKDLPSDVIAYRPLGKAFLKVPIDTMRRKVEEEHEDALSDVNRYKETLRIAQKAMKESEKALDETVSVFLQKHGNAS